MHDKSGERFDETFTTYLRIYVDAFCEITELKETDVSHRMYPGPASTRSGSRSDPPAKKFSTKFARRERVYTDDIDLLERTFRELVDDPTTGIEKDRRATARHFLEGGVVQRVRLLQAICESVPSDHERKLITDPAERNRLLGESIKCLAKGDRIPEDRKVCVAVCSSIYPGLTDKQLGFAYHAIGDAALDLRVDGTYGDLAVESFRMAVQQRFLDLVDSYFQFVRSKMKEEARKGLLLEDAQGNPDAITDQLMRVYRLLIADFPSLSAHFLADSYKIYAEFTEKVRSKTDKQIKEEFLLAEGLFRHAIEQHLRGIMLGENDDDLIHLQHNVGYCCHKSGQYKEALAAFQSAIRTCLKGPNVERIAYNFKWASRSHNELGLPPHNEPGHGRKALWCATVSNLIYSASTDFPEKDIQDAESNWRAMDQSWGRQHGPGIHFAYVPPNRLQAFAIMAATDYLEGIPFRHV